MKAELAEPCPNCGSTDISAGQEGEANSGIWAASCNDCDLRGPRVALSKRAALEAWDASVEIYNLIAEQITRAKEGRR